MSEEIRTPSPKAASRATSDNRWPLDFSFLKSPPALFATVATTILIVAAVLLIGLAVIAVVRLSIDLMSDDKQRVSEAIRSLLPLAAAAVGLPLIIWRLVILNEQTRISDAKTQIDRETHYTSIFSRSVEQLGQIREIKEAFDRDGAYETIVRTVPNVEVRLGGIHSLVRLAEESSRDLEKIENTLLSYVRENSWSARDGTTSKLLPLVRLSTFEWSHGYRRPEIPQSARNSLAEWTTKSAEEAARQLHWGGSLPETRVDVNEAIDAVAKLGYLADREAPRRFYESLFVGRVFNSDILNSCNFERCAFVRCRFVTNGTKTLNVASSRLINCVFQVSDSELTFRNVAFYDFTITSLSNASLHLNGCDIFELSIHELSDAKMMISSTTVHKGWIFASDPQEISFIGRFGSFLECRLGNLTLSSDSIFDHCAFANSSFAAVDMSAVSNVSENMLVHIKADPKTKHPTSVTRPALWPQFDPSFDDSDEVPF